MATRVFEGIKLHVRVCQEISEEDHGRIISVKFHQIWMGRFKEDV